jgi:thymidylate synthase (FAD)
MKIELLGYFGDDLMAANVARVSYGKNKEVFDKKDEKLLKYLVNHGHTSPFRHAHLQFRIKCSIFCERQIFKHEVGVAKNSISGRYVDFSDSYDIPTQLRYQSKDSKQGSGGDLPEELNKELVAEMQKVVDLAQKTYAKLCENGVAKEQARAILPLCLETTFIWTGSFQAFIHLCNLRLKSDTQKETRDVVTEMLRLVKEIHGEPFKFSMEAFGL